jgi:hypothetical protein
MKYSVLLVAVALTSWPASSQVQRPMPYPTTAQLNAAGDNYQSRTLRDGRSLTDLSKDRRECLTRRKTGRVECRTREQWQRLAAHMGTKDR